MSENPDNQKFEYSLVDEKKYFTSTITSIPINLSKMKSSEIPFTINILPELYNEEDLPISEEEVIRCNTCKCYINPFIQIISPGFKWKCNICMNINEMATPFYMTNRKTENGSKKFSLEENAIHNYNSYARTELKSTVYELYAPSSYSLRTPSPITLCFLIEATYESIKHGMFQVIAQSILDCIDPSLYDPRTKMMFMFFNSQIYILKKDLNLTILTDASFLPYFQKDDYLFNLSEKFEFSFLEDLFADMKNIKNNYGDCLKIAHSMLCKTGGTILSFLSTTPNFGPGLIDPGKTLKSDNIFFKELSGLFSKHLISVTHFLFPRLNIELPTLSILSKSTGGMLYYYPNFDGGDLVFATKLHKDLSDLFELRMSNDCVCRIRTSKDVFIKEYNGSLTQRTIDLLSFSNFFPPHTFNIDLEIVDNIKSDGISLQVALMRTTKNGTRMIRVINIKIPQLDIPFYDSIDPYAISRSLSLKAFYHEIQKKETGSTFLSKNLVSILRAYSKTTNSFNINNLPESLAILPMLFLSLCKSIPLRPVSYTPLDYRSFYMYLMSNSYPNFVDTIIYPTLLPLHHENIVPQNLTLDCLETNGLYLLDTGVTIYFFISKECPQEISELLFDSNQITGRFIFDPPQNEYSIKVVEIINELKKNRFLTPFYVLIRDCDENNLFREVFFTYFYEDALHGMPSYLKYIEMIKNTIK